MRIALRIFINIFAIIGFVVSALYGCRWIAKRNFDIPNYSTVINSPDGAFKAVIVLYIGGGGFAPYCNNRLYVASSQTSIEKIADDDNLVLWGDCGDFGSEEGRISDKSDVSWRDARTLTARILLPEKDATLKTFRFRRTAASGQIRVEFEVKQ